MTSIPCPVQKNARSAYKDNPAILADKTISYQQLDELIQGAVLSLTLRGIKQKTKVGLVSLRNTDFIIHYFALLRIQAVACLFSPKLPAVTLEKELKRLDCFFLISETKYSKKFRHVTHIPFSHRPGQILSMKNKKPAVVRYRLDDVSNIMFTSGSSGVPKAVVHTVANHYYSALGSNRRIPLGRGDEWMLSLPTHHVAGLSIIWRVFLAGASISIHHGKDLTESIIELKPTHVSLVMTQLIECMKDSRCRKVLSTMKCVLIGGSAVNRSVLAQALKNKLPIYLSYGLTEMSSQVATSQRLKTMDDIGSVKVLLHRRMKIDKDQNIFVSGKTLFKGFYVKGRIRRPFDRQGWYQTGDLGRFLKGRGLDVLGRRDNMFISGGENIHPEAIERIILEQGTVEQAVVVPRTDKLYGHRPVAFIKARKGERVNRPKLSGYLTARLEKFKIPDEFYRWPEKENLADMKVSRTKLKALAASHSKLLVKMD